MAENEEGLFAKRTTSSEIESGSAFAPKFDQDGLIPAIVTAAGSGEVLMFAWMNADALALTIETGIAHFWTRSRQRIWKKGEDSGNVLHITELRTDCDQDALWLTVHVAGDGVACHTGERSCFYRVIPIGSRPNPDLTLLRRSTRKATAEREKTPQ